MTTDLCRRCGVPYADHDDRLRGHRFRLAIQGTRRYAELTGQDIRGWEQSSRHPRKDGHHR